MQYFDCDKIQYEGPDSKNPLAFKHYHADEVIAGKTMKEHLRFAGAYWHVMRNDLSDPFGAGTALMPWDDGSDSVENALTRVDVFFEFLDKMGIEYYCWHDRDIAPELNDLSASNDALDQVVAKLKEKQAEIMGSVADKFIASYNMVIGTFVAPYNMVASKYIIV